MGKLKFRRQIFFNSYADIEYKKVVIEEKTRSSSKTLPQILKVNHFLLPITIS